MNGTEASLPVHDSNEDEREKFEFFLHQMSLTSTLVSFMKVSSLETKIDQSSSGDAPYTMTTTGLNDVII